MLLAVLDAEVLEVLVAEALDDLVTEVLDDLVADWLPFLLSCEPEDLVIDVLEDLVAELLEDLVAELLEDLVADPLRFLSLCWLETEEDLVAEELDDLVVEVLVLERVVLLLLLPLLLRRVWASDGIANIAATAMQASNVVNLFLMAYMVLEFNFIIVGIQSVFLRKSLETRIICGPVTEDILDLESL